MTVDQLIDWGLRVVMLALTVLVALWGRSQKQADDLVQAKADALARLAKHDREALQAQASEAQHHLARLFESELSKRDQRMAHIEKQLEDAAERASTAASKLTGKMGDVDHRLTVLETRMGAS